MSVKGILNWSSSYKNHLLVSTTSQWVRCETSQAVQNNWELIVSNLGSNCFTNWDHKTDGMNIFKDGDKTDVTPSWIPEMNNVSHRFVIGWKGLNSGKKKKGCQWSQWSPDAVDGEDRLLLLESAPPSADPIIKTFNYSLCANKPWNRYGFHHNTKGL